ncbi:MAG: hypothetical protein WCO84_02540 [bacterium]
MKNYSSNVSRRFLLAIVILSAFFLVSCDNGNHVKLDESSRDADMMNRGNFEFIVKNKIDFKSEVFVLEKKKFKFSVFSKMGSKDIRIIVCHDSENIAFDVGLRAIKDGGVLLAFENGEFRNLYDFGAHAQTHQDPNRIFYEDGPYWPLANRVLSVIFSGKNRRDEVLIALHNNNPRGDFGITNLKKKKEICVESSLDTDEKNLIWLSGEDKTSGKFTKEINFYKKSRLNVVYERIDDGSKGSLSNYTARKRIPYVNIEVRSGRDREGEKGAIASQTHYLDKVRTFHGI